MQKSAKTEQGKYSGKYALSELLVCGECGSPFRRRQRKNMATWVCESKTHKERHPDVHCGMDSIREDVLSWTVVFAFSRLPEFKEELEGLLRGVEADGLAKLDARLTSIDEQLEGLGTAPEDGWSDPWAAEERENLVDELRGQRDEISMQRAEAANKALQIRGLLHRIEVMQGGGKATGRHMTQGACTTPDEFFAMSEPPYVPNKFNEDDVFRYVERIVRYPEEVEVQFKAGVSLRVRS